jgi:hypothetical protein
MILVCTTPATLAILLRMACPRRLNLCNQAGPRFSRQTHNDIGEFAILHLDRLEHVHGRHGVRRMQQLDEEINVDHDCFSTSGSTSRELVLHGKLCGQTHRLLAYPDPPIGQSLTSIRRGFPRAKTQSAVLLHDRRSAEVLWRASFAARPRYDVHRSQSSSICFSR